MQSLKFRRKAAVCRRLAQIARQREISSALLELAVDFEQAADECEAEEDAPPAKRRNGH
jgi:hypothetical protein